MKKRITLTLNPDLYGKITDKLKKDHLEGNYKHRSNSDFIRQAIISLKEGELAINYQDKVPTENKMEVGIRVSDELYDFYKTLPMIKKSLILNLAIKTYLERES